MKLEIKTKEPTISEAVENWLSGYPKDEQADALSDLLSHGCQSGMVGSLIYHSDTLAFFKTHKQEINEMLVDAMQSCGFDSPAALFGDKWDKEDPLANDTNNQNILAWFGFEETARLVADGRGVEC